MLKPKISASMMCADFLNLKQDLEDLEQARIEFLHMDIMDGVFVPNLMLPNELLKSMRKATKIPFDIHMMIVNPEQKIKWFDLCPDDLVSVHYESTPHIHRALQEIKNCGAKSAVAINPGTPVSVLESLIQDVDMVLVMTVNPGFAGQKLVPQTLEKVTAVRRMLNERGYADTIVQVDGNCSFENIPKMIEAGADCFVAGTSSVFNRNTTILQAVERLRGVMR